MSMRHIERFVWKPIDWYPESPDQYPDGLPTPKVENWLVDLGKDPGQVGGNNYHLEIEGRLFGPMLRVSLYEEMPSGRWVSCGARLGIPADRVQDVVDALLYVHRRTHEHEYTGPDAGLGDGEEAAP